MFIFIGSKKSDTVLHFWNFLSLVQDNWIFISASEFKLLQYDILVVWTDM